MKNILIAGAGGYIGSRMTKFFLDKGYRVTALDRFYFGNTLKSMEKNKKLLIVREDIRSLDKNLLRGVDTVINLASISNDPASELNPKVTQQINNKGAVKLARLSKESGVKKYIFSSSCSVYGMGENKVDEKSKLYPLSEYAKSKITAEKKILELSNSSFCTTVLRLSTLYGLSEKRMRFDLIVNLMTLHAWKNKKIFILGGGKQWRPLIHIDDCINAFYIVLDAQKKIINKQIFNVGSNDQNYQVFQVANILKRFFPEIDIEIAPDDPDQRSYRVNFDKFTRALYFKPKKTIEDGVREIKEALEKGKITDDLRTNTLWYYKHLIESNDLLSKIKIRGKLF